MLEQVANHVLAHSIGQGHAAGPMAPGY